ncbi:MAG: hypothetical protein WAL45_10530 [Terracidiphilus sp.]
MSELFETNLEKATDPSRRSRWILIVVLVLLIAGGFFAWHKFAPQSTLYDSEISRLKPGMSDLDIFDVLGAPNHVIYEPVEKISIYGVPGARQRLLVRTSDQRYATGIGDTIQGWCILALRSGKPKDGSAPSGIDQDQTIGADSYYESIKCKDMSNAGADSTSEP